MNIAAIVRMTEMSQVTLKSQIDRFPNADTQGRPSAPRKQRESSNYVWWLQIPRWHMEF